MTTPTIDRRDAQRTAEFLSTHSTPTGNLSRAYLNLLDDFKAAFQAGLDAEAEIDSLSCELDEAQGEDSYA